MNKILDPALVNTLRCVNCGKENLKVDGNDLFCSVCSNKFPVRGGKVYFIEVPKEINPEIEDDPGNREKWTWWRKSNYAFFNSYLKDERGGA